MCMCLELPPLTVYDVFPYDIHVPHSSGLLLLFLVLRRSLHMSQKLFINVGLLLFVIKYSLNFMSDNKIFKICDVY
jgi:hypothetical protein